MKMVKSVLVTAIVVICLLGEASARAAILTFEKFSPGMDHFSIPNGYGGLNWENFQVLNSQNQSFRTGYRAGMVSASNVIFNSGGDPATITCAKLFKLESAYITAAIIDGLTLQVKGFAGAQLRYDRTYQLSASAPSFIQFDYENVDRLVFSTSPASQFAIDNLTVDVPGAAPENEPIVQTAPPAPPVNLGRIVVESIGIQELSSLIGLSQTAYYLVDQAQSSGGGALLPNVNIDWDTNTEFAATFAAPEGKRFAIKVPPNASAGFGAFLSWETGDRDGFSASGPITVAFENVLGAMPNFYESDAVLSSSHGFFGVRDLESTLITNDLSFTAMTIHGKVSPQVTGAGVQPFVPHHDSKLLIYDAGGGASLSLVPSSDGQSSPTAATVTISPAANGMLVLHFDGVLQTSDSVNGPFEDVPGNPQGQYTVSAGSAQFFRTRN